MENPGNRKGSVCVVKGCRRYAAPKPLRMRDPKDRSKSFRVWLCPEHVEKARKGKVLRSPVARLERVQRSKSNPALPPQVQKSALGWIEMKVNPHSRRHGPPGRCRGPAYCDTCGESLRGMEVEALRNPKTGMPTPWGPAQHIGRTQGGALWVSTAGHGGLLVPKSLAAKRLSDFALGAGHPFGNYYAYEEDCDWAVVGAEAPDLVASVPSEQAERSLSFHPDTQERRKELERIGRWRRAGGLRSGKPVGFTRFGRRSLDSPVAEGAFVEGPYDVESPQPSGFRHKRSMVVRERRGMKRYLAREQDVEPWGENPRPRRRCSRCGQVPETRYDIRVFRSGLPVRGGPDRIKCCPDCMQVLPMDLQDRRNHLQAKREYKARIDGGEGGMTTVMAENAVDALDMAEDWCIEGSWNAPGLAFVEVMRGGEIVASSYVEVGGSYDGDYHGPHGEYVERRHCRTFIDTEGK
ncbi:MAG: hypothetical protein ABID40_01270 [Candidatus Bipolaricaulota bacterium]